MSLVLEELDTLTAGNLTFESTHGSLTSYGLNHPDANMKGVTGITKLIVPSEERTVHFANMSSSFRTLDVYAQGGIMIDDYLTVDTNEGFLAFYFHHGNFTSNTTLQ